MDKQYSADFLFGFADDSIESLGYEFANAKTEAYQKECWEQLVAGNHLCWFSRIEKYKSMTVNQLLKENPEYIIWCRDNLSHLRFATGLLKRIKKARKELITFPSNQPT